MSLVFKVKATKITTITPGNKFLNIDLDISYAELLSMTKQLQPPFKARFEIPGGKTFESPVGIGKGVAAMADARITLRNFEGEMPAGTIVTLIE